MTEPEQPKTQAESRLLSRQEVAVRLGVHPNTITRLSQTGQLRPIVLSPNLVRYEASAVEALIDARRR